MNFGSCALTILISTTKQIIHTYYVPVLGQAICKTEIWCMGSYPKITNNLLEGKSQDIMMAAAAAAK